MIIHAGKEFQVKLTTSKPLEIEKSSSFPKLEKGYLLICVCHLKSYTFYSWSDVASQRAYLY